MVHVKTRVLIIVGRYVDKAVATYLRVIVIQSFDGSLNTAAVDVILNFLPAADGTDVLLEGQVSLLRKVCGGARVALHRQVIQYDGINVTVRVMSASCFSDEMRSLDVAGRTCQVSLELDIVSPHGILGEIPIDMCSS